MSLRAFRSRAVPGAVLVALAACAKSAPAPAPPAPEPVPAPAAPAALAAVLAPARVAGMYRLTTEVARGGPNQGRQAAARPTPLRLLAGAAPNPDPMAGHQGTQYAATGIVPGYVRAPRARNAPAASWWPAPGDSVIVHMVGERGNRLQLRGALSGGAIRGDIWLTSAETGTTYQLGTFVAERDRR